MLGDPAALDAGLDDSTLATGDYTRVVKPHNGSAIIECASPASTLPLAFTADGTPQYLSAHELPLSVAPDGSTFAASSLIYTYYAEPDPYVVSPTSGPLAGGTAVRCVSHLMPRSDAEIPRRDPTP